MMMSTADEALRTTTVPPAARDYYNTTNVAHEHRVYYRCRDAWVRTPGVLGPAVAN